MVNKLLIVGLTFAFCSIKIAEAQDEQFVKRGLLRSQATFAPGIMIGQNSYNIYLNFDIEYFIDNKISLRNDSYIYLMTMSGDNAFKHYHTNFTGAAYHFTFSNVDLNLSFQPGLGFIQSNQTFINDFQVKEAQFKVVPMLAIGSGVNFYVHKYFHFLMHLKYTKGTYTGGKESLKINEFLFSAGLGWNINLK